MSRPRVPRGSEWLDEPPGDIESNWTPPPIWCGLGDRGSAEVVWTLDPGPGRTRDTLERPCLTLGSYWASWRRWAEPEADAPRSPTCIRIKVAALQTNPVEKVSWLFKPCEKIFPAVEGERLQMFTFVSKFTSFKMSHFHPPRQNRDFWPTYMSSLLQVFRLNGLVLSGY